jgi:hypothetical protein
MLRSKLSFTVLIFSLFCLSFSFVSASSLPIFYESFNDLNSIQSNLGHCGGGYGAPLCSEDQNIIFVLGLDGNGVKFGGGPECFDENYNRTNACFFKQINFVSGTIDQNQATVEFWVKPIIGYSGTYNSALTGIFGKISVSKPDAATVTGFWQYEGVDSFLYNVPENSIGWHKAVFTVDCDINEMGVYVDDKLIKKLIPNFICSALRTGTFKFALGFGNPYDVEVTNSTIDEAKVFNYAKSFEEIKEDYYAEVSNPLIDCNSNSDCGSDDWVDSSFCSNNTAFKNYKTFTCNNPSAPNSVCSSLIAPKLIETCSAGCNKGYCVISNPQIEQFMKGMNYTSWWFNEYESNESNSSLSLLKQSTNSTWVSILATQYLDSFSDTNIKPISYKTPTDLGIVKAIQKIHSLGMKVSLKPHVDVGANSSGYRGYISYSLESDWNKWFESYKNFILHYANIAQANNVELFVIGTELSGTSQREIDWRNIISEVRRVYSGKIVYAANHDEYSNISWWSALDYVGVDAYFRLTDKLDPSIWELQDSFAQHMNGLDSFAADFNKKIILTEIGFQSRDGTNITPWSSSRPLDLNEQADCYNAVLEVMKNDSNIQGAFFWNWLTSTTQGGLTDLEFTPYRKPAQAVIADYYGKSFAVDAFIPIIQCVSNTDCGIDSWFGLNYCNSNNIWGIFRAFVCNNPGTINSNCSFVDSNQLKDLCLSGQICSNAVCVTPFCSSDLECNDNNSFTVDVCVNPGTANSVCTNSLIPIVCSTDLECNDNNSLTADTCLNPNTLFSVCVFTPIPIICFNDAGCNDNDSLTVDVCLNPGTSISACQHNPVIIACSSDAQCGSNGLVGKVCNGNYLYDLMRSYTCNNPGAGNSFCSVLDVNSFNQTCNYGCSNGICLTGNVVCSTNSECNDNNSNTDDLCINPGTLESVCNHSPIVIACSNNLQCNDNNSVTTDTCVNPGTVLSSCAHTITDCSVTNSCGVIFYESFNDLNSIQSNLGRCGGEYGAPFCREDHNIVFVPGLKGTGVKFGGNFIKQIGYSFQSNALKKGTIEFWVKPTVVASSIWNSDLTGSTGKISIDKPSASSSLQALWQYKMYGSFNLTLLENSIGWHKATFTWNCDTNAVTLYIDDKLFKQQLINNFYPSCVDNFNPIFLQFGNPYLAEPSNSTIDEAKVFNYVKTFSEIKQDYYEKVHLPVVKCSYASDCGSNTWIGEQVTCNGNSIAQMYRTFSCINPGKVTSYCSSVDALKNKSACLTTQICSNGACVVPTCKTNTQCNDNNVLTIDKCVNPNTINSTCTHTPIACTASVQCGVNAWLNQTTCSGNNIGDFYRTFTCVLPGTLNSYCKSVDTLKTKSYCASGTLCSSGVCVKPTCSSNTQCNDSNSYTSDVCVNPGKLTSVCTHGEIRCLAAKDCNDNNLFTMDVCKSPGLVTSVCVYTPIACTNNVSCDDKNVLTIDSCSYPNTTSSKCNHVGIKCASNLNCEDNNSLTSNICENPGTTSSICKFYPLIPQTIWSIAPTSWNSYFGSATCNILTKKVCPDEMGWEGRSVTYAFVLPKGELDNNLSFNFNVVYKNWATSKNVLLKVSAGSLTSSLKVIDSNLEINKLGLFTINIPKSNFVQGVTNYIQLYGNNITPVGYGTNPPNFKIDSISLTQVQ